MPKAKSSAAPSLVHSVSVAEFDIDVGNTLTLRYPEFEFALDHQELANLCLPDGAHIHTEDWTFIILKPKEMLATASNDDDGTLPPHEADAGCLYGMALFRNIRDKSVRRGAVQKSMLILMRQPLFALVASPLREAITHLMTKGDKAAPKKLYQLVDELAKNGTANGFDRTFTSSVPHLHRDQFGGASLVALLMRFRESTMHLWYAILRGERILFCGQPAHEVGNACLVCPLLVAPLKGFTRILSPYVSLTHSEPIEQPSYIAGTTNMIFETKSQMYDAIALVASGTVTARSGRSLSSADRLFIRNVLSGLDNGEQWVRAQFHNFTFSFLKALEDDKLSGNQKKYLADFKTSRLFAQYQRDRAAVSEQKPPAATADPVQVLKDMQALPPTDMIKRTKAVFELAKSLAAADLSLIDAFLDADGVTSLAPGLSETNANMRKYSAQCLASVAVSVRAQTEIISCGALSVVIKLIHDQMPNVAAAACECLCKVASLYIGASALAESNVISSLIDIVCGEADNLTLKTWAAAALNKIYQLKATDLLPDFQALMELSNNVDPQFREHVLTLLDRFEVYVPNVTLSPDIVQSVQSLQASDTDTRCQATSLLLSELKGKRHLVLEFLRAGGVVLLLENERLEPATHRLSRLCWSVLAIVADTHAGRVDLARLNVLERAFHSLGSNVPMYSYHVVRFIEVCCQHVSSARRVAKDNNGVRVLLEFFYKNLKVKLHPLCAIALRALRNLFQILPDFRYEIQAEVDRIRPLYGLAHDDVVPATNRVWSLTASTATAESVNEHAQQLISICEHLVEGRTVELNDRFFADLAWTANPMFVDGAASEAPA